MNIENEIKQYDCIIWLIGYILATMIIFRTILFTAEGFIMGLFIGFGLYGIMRELPEYVEKKRKEVEVR